MKTVKTLVIANPQINMEFNAIGPMILHELEKKFPKLAYDFLGLFLYSSAGEPVAIAAVGSQFVVESKKNDNILFMQLKNEGKVELGCSFTRENSETYHEHIFRSTAVFIDRARHYLTSHYGLSDETLMLGGWQSGTFPESIEEPLIFTIPRITCVITNDEIMFRYFEDEDCTEMSSQLSNFRCDQVPPTNVDIIQRQNIPDCVDYVDSLVDLIRELSIDQMDKVVICRKVKLTLQNKISPAGLLRIAAANRKNQYEYVFRWSNGDAWVGVSPETLLRKSGTEIVVEPLAGTRKGSDSNEKSLRYRQELLSDKKEIEEHETAAKMFYEHLETVCIPESLELLESRCVIDLGYVQHLKSKISGNVKVGMNVFHVLAAVYPPATIWGKPVVLSGDRIRNYEKIERGFYTGSFGFFTLGDDANFALAIRTAKISQNEVHIYAGSGVVKASDPYREWLETTNKMEPFLAHAN